MDNSWQKSKRIKFEAQVNNLVILTYVFPSFFSISFVPAHLELSKVSFFSATSTRTACRIALNQVKTTRVSFKSDCVTLKIFTALLNCLMLSLSFLLGCRSKCQHIGLLQQWTCAMDHDLVRKYPCPHTLIWTVSWEYPLYTVCCCIGEEKQSFVKDFVNKGFWPNRMPLSAVSSYLLHINTEGIQITLVHYSFNSLYKFIM